MDYSKYITEGKGRCDLSLLLKDTEIFNNAIEDMAEPFRDSNIGSVAALDALGFVFGTAVAQKLKVGLVLVRKEGKLPVDAQSVTFSDYSNTQKGFEVAVSSVKSGERLLVVDEWSETGSQIKAAIALLEKMGGLVVGASCFHIAERVKSDPALQGYKLHSLHTSGQ